MTKTVLLTSLSKIFPSSIKNEERLSAASLFLNERFSFQLAVKTDEPEAFLRIVSPLAKHIKAYSIGLVPSELEHYKDCDEDIIEGENGLFPDVLRPMQDEKILLLDEGYTGIWFELEPNGDEPGEYPVEIRLESCKGKLLDAKSFSIELLSALLPEQKLIYTNWFHCDCLANYYKVPVFSEEHWRLIEAFLAEAGRHGMNFVLTPLFMPPLDIEPGRYRATVQLVDVTRLPNGKYEFGFDRLKRFVDLAQRCGMKYFEMSHLFTQWGARHAPKIVDTDGKMIFGWSTRAGGREYTEFLTQLSVALTAFIDGEGIREKCFFHVSDEPGLKDMRCYGKASRLMHSLFPGFRFIDALSDFVFFKKGLVTTPIPSTTSIEKFIGKVPELWAYYCCGQYKNVSNRFFSMPSRRNRVLGLQLWKYNVTGFLQWGLNFWNSQYSRREIDPFKETAAGGAFPSGDAFVLYPGENGEPLPSLRFKVFFEGLQDMRALELLESLAGREKALEILERGMKEPLSFSSYPCEDSFICRKREEINSEIKKLL